MASSGKFKANGYILYRVQFQALKRAVASSGFPQGHGPGIYLVVSSPQAGGGLFRLELAFEVARYMIKFQALKRAVASSGMP